MILDPLLPTWINIAIGVLILAAMAQIYLSLKRLNLDLKKKIILITLRFIPATFLFILLLNPFKLGESTIQHRPNLLILQDTSSSISITTNQYQGNITANNIYRRISELQFSFAELSFHYFSDKTTIPIEYKNPPRFEGFATDIYQQFENINYYATLYDAAILITDGIHTHGKNPFFFNTPIKLPTYVIGLGDTTIVSDLFVQQINSNRRAYLDQPHPIDLEIQALGMAGDSIEIQLYQNNTLVETHKAKIQTRSQKITHRFSITPSKEGHLPLKIAIVPHNKEWNKNNNQEDFALFIQKYHKKIVHFAFTISSDVRAIRQVLSSYENFQWQGRTWIGDRFIEGTLDQAIENADLYILHGTPPPPIQSAIQNIIKDAPIIFFSHENNPYFNINKQLGKHVPIPTVDELGQYKKGWVEVSPSKIGQTIISPPPVDPRSLPPLYFKSIATTPPNWINIMQSLSSKPSPIIWAQQKANLRQVSIMAQDWYKWLRHRNNEIKQWSYTIFANLISWCSTNKNNESIQLVLPKSTFSTRESIPISAYLIDEIAHSTKEENLKLEIYKKDSLYRHFILQPQKKGIYETEISPLEQGIYGLKLTHNNISESNQNGSITYINIQSTPIEYKNTQRNDILLNSIAERSGGFFYPMIK